MACALTGNTHTFGHCRQLPGNPGTHQWPIDVPPPRLDNRASDSRRTPARCRQSCAMHATRRRSPSVVRQPLLRKRFSQRNGAYGWQIVSAVIQSSIRVWVTRALGDLDPWLSGLTPVWVDALGRKVGVRGVLVPTSISRNLDLPTESSSRVDGVRWCERLCACVAWAWIWSYILVLVSFFITHCPLQEQILKQISVFHSRNPHPNPNPINWLVSWPKQPKSRRNGGSLFTFCRPSLNRWSDRLSSSGLSAIAL